MEMKSYFRAEIFYNLIYMSFPEGGYK